MTVQVFVDANIFIYARDPAEPRKQARAAQWLEQLWRTGLGRTSMQVLSECYVTLTRKLAARVPEEQAWEEIDALFAWRPQPIDQALAVRAREIERRYKLSWWDSMVVAAAQLQDCALLLTEDLQDGMAMGSVTVRSPFTLAVNEPVPGYSVLHEPASRHRPRGRPKRAQGFPGT